jgi:hypothetical protein
MRLKDMTGWKFGRLAVVCRTGNIGKDTAWMCRCDCGNMHIVAGCALRSRMTVSCGCWRRDRITKHGQSMQSARSAGYGIWSAMKDRCSNHKNKGYAAYGGRGIRVCDRWCASFEDFIADMGSRPSRRHSIDRINVNGNYEPGNCKWSTRKEQDLNRRDIMKVRYHDATVPLRTAVEMAGDVVMFATAKWRVKHGWPVTRAVETPSP